MQSIPAIAKIPLRADEAAGTSDLAAKARRGDLQAFEALYREHAGQVYAICLRMTADQGRAEILTQDAFVRAWSKLDRYQERGPFGAWLRRLTVNTVIEDCRRLRREARIGGPEWIEDGEGTAAPAARSHGTQAELAMDLDRALARLPQGARQVFLLHDVHGYKLREISGLMRVSEGGLKAQLHRARRLLRNALDPDWKVSGHDA